MKKLTALFLAALLAALCCGCGTPKGDENAKASSSAYAVDIAALAAGGKIPEIKFALGANVDELKEKFKDTVEPGAEVDDLTETQGEKTVWLDGGSVLFCYEKAKKENGISLIVAREYAYNFSMGGVYAQEDVIAAMGDLKYEKSAATDDDVFFMPTTPANCEKLSYVTGKNVLNFIFVDGTLSAVVLYNPENWTV